MSDEWPAEVQHRRQNSYDYSVRSAYRLLKNDQAAMAMAATAEASASGEDRAWTIYGMEAECASEGKGVLVASSTQLLAIKIGTETEAYCTRKPL